MLFTAKGIEPSDITSISPFRKSRCVSLVKAEWPFAWMLLQKSVVSKDHQFKSETWWWNEQVDEAIRFKIYSALKKGGMIAEITGAKTAHIDAKRMTKRAVWLAKSEAENIARAHGCVRNDSETHSTGVTGLQSSNTVSCTLAFITYIFCTNWIEMALG